jgi:DNA-binding response OmpR family regulator
MIPAAPPKGEKFRILIVEDDANIGRLMTLNLTTAGFNCQHALDGNKGYEMFRMTDPHLVLTDVMMPGMSGRELCAKIRETSTIPIIMMTALDGEEDHMTGFKVGADDYVPKPFNPKLMVARVVAQLRRVYRYDQNEEKIEESKTPMGWATCSSCGYMGPKERFAVTRDNDHRLMCPVCKRTEFITFEVKS